MAKTLVRLASNETEYNEMLNWKNLPRDKFQESHLMYFSSKGYDLICNLCARIADTLDPQLEILDNEKKQIKVRRAFDFYYKTIELPNTLVDLKAKILTEFKLDHEKNRILRMYPSKWKFMDDNWFNQDFNLDSDEKVRNLPHGFQLEFIFLNL